MKRVRILLTEYLCGVRAVSALEYAILAGVIVVAVAAALATFGDDLTTAIEAVGDNVIASQKGVGKTP